MQIANLNLESQVVLILGLPFRLSYIYFVVLLIASLAERSHFRSSLFFIQLVTALCFVDQPEDTETNSGGHSFGIRNSLLN